jgi:hypothetical protein
MNTNPEPRNIEGAHCQACGSTRPEHIRDLRDTEGYTRCCNERVVNPNDRSNMTPQTCARSGDCYHA